MQNEMENGVDFYSLLTHWPGIKLGLQFCSSFEDQESSQRFFTLFFSIGYR